MHKLNTHIPHIQASIMDMKHMLDKAENDRRMSMIRGEQLFQRHIQMSNEMIAFKQQKKQQEEINQLKQQLQTAPAAPVNNSDDDNESYIDELHEEIGDLRAEIFKLRRKITEKNKTIDQLIYRRECVNTLTFNGQFTVHFSQQLEDLCRHIYAADNTSPTIFNKPINKTMEDIHDRLKQLESFINTRVTIVPIYEKYTDTQILARYYEICDICKKLYHYL